MRLSSMVPRVNFAVGDPLTLFDPPSGNLSQYLYLGACHGHQKGNLVYMKGAVSFRCVSPLYVTKIVVHA